MLIIDQHIHSFLKDVLAIETSSLFSISSEHFPGLSGIITVVVTDLMKFIGISVSPIHIRRIKG